LPGSSGRYDRFRWWSVWLFSRTAVCERWGSGTGRWCRAEECPRSKVDKMVVRRQVKFGRTWCRPQLKVIVE
jgi:hypothetical protein